MAFGLKSILNPDTSVMVGLANGGIIMGIYSNALPSFASIRTADPQDKDIETARKQAAWTSGAVLGFMFLLTRDRNSFLIGGLVLAGVDMLVKHANGVNPMTGLLTMFDGKDDVEPLDMESGQLYPMPDYGDQEVAG
jgi:hypothetical protein